VFVRRAKSAVFAAADGSLQQRAGRGHDPLGERAAAQVDEFGEPAAGGLCAASDILLGCGGGGCN